MSEVKKMPIKEEIEVATADKKVAMENLRKETERKETIDAIQFDTIQLPKAEESLAKITSSLDALTANGNQMKELVERAKKVSASLDAFREMEKACEDILYRTRLFTEASAYEDASKTIAELQSYINMNYGFDAKFKVLLSEILAWTSLKIVMADQMHRVANGQEPLALDLLLAAKEEVQVLPLEFHSSEEKNALIEKCFGLVAGYYFTRGYPKCAADLEAQFALIGDYARLENEHDPQVEKSFANLREASVDGFNLLSYSFDSANANYDEALALFRLRSNLNEEEISFSLFREPADEKEFRLCFLKNVSIQQNDEQFAAHIEEVKPEVATSGDDITEWMASLYMVDSFGQEKSLLLNRLYGYLPFERKIQLIVLLLKQNAPEELIVALFEEANSMKDRSLDLEARGEDLLALSTNAPEAIQKPATKLIKGLLRGTKAHRVVGKTTNVSLRKLKNPKAKPVQPVGKKAKTTVVKPVPVGCTACFWILAFVLPLLCALAGGYVLYHFQAEVPYYSLMMAIPVAVIAIVGIVMVLALSGRDERPAAKIRRVYGVVGLIFGAVALAYYIVPDVLSFFATYQYTLIVSGAIFLFAGPLALKDYHKRWDYILYLPLLLIEIAALVLLVVRALA
ncbi:MAG: hypothetical protein ACI32C_02330 [Candidatus Enteromonas sp.]